MGSVKRFSDWLLESSKPKKAPKYVRDLKFQPMQKDMVSVVPTEDYFSSWELKKQQDAEEIVDGNIHIPALKIIVNPESSSKNVNYKKDIPSTSYGQSIKPPSLKNLPDDLIKFSTRWFMHGGLSKEGAAALVANLWRESYLNPKQLQIGGGPGRGIAQWDNGGERWNEFVGTFLPKFTSSDHALSSLNKQDLEAQLSFVLYELKKHDMDLYKELITPGRMRIKTIAVLQDYEVARDKDKPEEQQVRYDIARDIYYNIMSSDSWGNTIHDVVDVLKDKDAQKFA